MAPEQAMTADYAEVVLQWYLDNGVDEAMGAVPMDRLAVRETIAVLSPPHHVVTNNKEPVVSASPAYASPVKLQAMSEFKAEAEKLAQEANSLDALKESIRSFAGMDIRKTAMNMVFSDGNPAAQVMVIGDAPETEDDRSGLPFSGDVGALTDKMFAAIGLSRRGDMPENSIYLTNVLNWRPPGNRSPSPAEIEMSLPFIFRHIELVRPRVVFVMGGLAAKALFKSEDTIGKLRGKWKGIMVGGAGGYECPALATYHPSFLLKSPTKKKEAWDDLQLLKKKCTDSAE